MSSNTHVLTSNNNPIDIILFDSVSRHIDEGSKPGRKSTQFKKSSQNLINKKKLNKNIDKNNLFLHKTYSEDSVKKDPHTGVKDTEYKSYRYCIENIKNGIIQNLS